MCYQKEGRASVPARFKDEVGHLATRISIQVSSWLIGNQNSRTCNQRSCNRHPLLFASRKLCRKMTESITKSHKPQFLARLVEGIAITGEFQRHGDILQSGHVRDKVKGLENDPDMAASKDGKAVLIHGANRLSGNAHTALVCAFQSGHDHQQRGLARTARSQNSDAFPLRNLQGCTGQDMDTRRAIAQGEVNVIEFDDHFLFNNRIGVTCHETS